MFIFSIYGTSLTHSLLGPLNLSFTFELNGLKSLIVALQEINRWRFYEALISVRTFFCKLSYFIRLQFYLLIMKCNGEILTCYLTIYLSFIPFQLDQGRNCLAGWSELMSTSIRGFDNILSTTSKMTFFSSFKSSLRSSSIRAADQVDIVVLHITIIVPIIYPNFANFIIITRISNTIMSQHGLCRPYTVFEICVVSVVLKYSV